MQILYYTVKGTSTTVFLGFQKHNEVTCVRRKSQKNTDGWGNDSN